MFFAFVLLNLWVGLGYLAGCEVVGLIVRGQLSASVARGQLSSLVAWEKLNVKSLFSVLVFPLWTCERVVVLFYCF